MSLDDPGWGEYVPPADDSDKTTERATPRVPPPAQPTPAGAPPAAQHPAALAQPAAPHQPAQPFPPLPRSTPPAGSRPQRPTRAIVAAVVVVLVVAGGIVYAVSGGSPNKKRSSPPANTHRATHTVITHSSSTTVSHATQLSKAEFISRADAICTRYAPLIAEDEANADVASLENDAGEEISDITALGPPSEGAGTVTQILNEDEQALQTLAQDDIASFETDATAAEELAGEFGFQACAGGASGSGTA